MQPRLRSRTGEKIFEGKRFAGTEISRCRTTSLNFTVIPQNDFYEKIFRGAIRVALIIAETFLLLNAFATLFAILPMFVLSVKLSVVVLALGSFFMR